MLLAAVVCADTVYVSTNGSGGGASWGAAASLANALVVCQDGDQLWIEGGIYSNDWDGANSFIISTNNLTLYGGFTNGMTLLSDRNYTNYPVVLDGDDTLRIFYITATNGALDGLIMQKGAAKGGGVYKESGCASLTLANCSFLDTYRPTAGANPSHGGGAYFDSGSVMMTNCAFLNNNRYYYYYQHGGGFYADGTDVVMVDCTFTNNKSNAAGGGGFYLTGGSLAVTNSTFYDNVATGAKDAHGGGAGFITDASARFMNCVFRGNEARNVSGNIYGGVLNIHGSAATTVTVENCTIVDNSSEYRGGAFYVNSGNLIVKNSIMWTNVADDGGHTIYNYAADSVVIEYCCMDGTDNGYVAGGSSQSYVISTDPLFATTNYVDLHLKSSTGRWDAATGVWTNDAVHSPCIDAGDPSRDYSGEPANNNNRLNLGAYGNTWQASKSPSPVAPVLTNRAPESTFNVATIKGELLAGTPSLITFWYGTNQASLDHSVQALPLKQTGTVFTVDIGDLVSGKEYWYTCFATNAAGTNWANPYTNFLTTAAPGGGATIIHVDKDAISPAETGKDWYNAFKSIAAATAAAGGSTDTMWIAQGTYPVPVSATIATNLAIYGGFTNGMTALGQRNYTNYPVVFDACNDRRVFYVSGGVVTIDGLTMQRGQAHGGGVYKDTGCGSLTLANCNFLDNYRPKPGGVPQHGGGAYLDSGSVTMTNCAFLNNNRYYYYYQNGGGFYADGADVVAIDCTFTNNRNANACGAAFYLTGGSLVASNCSFIANSTTGGNDADGGGVGFMLGGASARFKNCVFTGNRVPSAKGYGGVLHMQGSVATTVTVENCTLADNYSGYRGGAFYVKSGNLIVRNSILWTNVAVDAGHIIYNAGSQNVTIDHGCLDGTSSDYVSGGNSQSNIITNEPRFAVDYVDLHLKSYSGRWDVVTEAWTNDAVHSPCIDTGTRTGDYSKEPAYNGGRINLGAYGNTWQASKSPTAVSPVVTNRAPTVQCNVATFRGEVLQGSLSTVGFWYGTNQASLANFREIVGLYETGTVFTVQVGDLIPSVQYWVTCSATNPAGTNWANPYTNFLTTAPPSGGATIIHVDKDAISPVETGKDWYNAFKTIAAATAVAGGSTDTMWIAEGTYPVPVTATIATSLTIYGGFTNGMTSLSQRNYTNYPVVFDAGDSRRVFYVTGGVVTIDGLTMERGLAKGGGVYKDSGCASLALANCSFLNSYRPEQGADPSHGGGAYFDSGSVMITNCAFLNNNRYYYYYQNGGGFYADGADVVVVDCTFTNNKSHNAGGGGFHVTGGSLAVTNSTFSDNRVTGANVDDGGGAGYITGASARFMNCRFKGNEAPSAKGYGAVLNIHGSAATTVTVENCTLADNYSWYRGGAFYLDSGNLIVQNSILWSNVADDAGSIAYNAGSESVTIDYSCLNGTNPTYLAGNNFAVSNFMTNDPLFAVEYTDLHLKSRFGRWDPALAGWVQDDYVSPCIDAGDPDSAYLLEPFENGGVINLGAYGNTVQASKSPSSGGSVFIIW